MDFDNEVNYGEAVEHEFDTTRFKKQLEREEKQEKEVERLFESKKAAKRVKSPVKKKKKAAAKGKAKGTKARKRKRCEVELSEEEDEDEDDIKQSRSAKRRLPVVLTKSTRSRRKRSGK